VSDTARDIVIGFFAAALLSGLASEHVQRVLERQLRRDLRTRDVQVRVDQAGPLGMLFGRASAVRVRARSATVDQAPFALQPGSGLSAHARQVRLDLRGSRLAGLEADRLLIHFGDAYVDVGALLRERVVLRRSDAGKATITVGEELLAKLVSLRYPAYRDVTARVRADGVTVMADLDLLGVRSQIEVAGHLLLRDGTQVDVVSPSVRVNGRALDASASESLIRPMNPVLDLDRDMGIGLKVRATGVQLESGRVRLDAEVWLPVKRDRPEGEGDGAR